MQELQDGIDQVDLLRLPVNVLLDHVVMPKPVGHFAAIARAALLREGGIRAEGSPLARVDPRHTDELAGESVNTAGDFRLGHQIALVHAQHHVAPDASFLDLQDRAQNGLFQGSSAA